MTVLIVEPGKVPRRAEIGENLSAMQEVVGGPIQAIYPFDEPVALVCHEEGKLLNLPKNRFLTGEDGLVYDVVVGNFFLCSAPANSENFESLTEEQVAHYQKVFLTPDFIEKEEAENFACSHCDRTLPDMERADFDGRVLCARCRSMLTSVCDHCGARIWRGDDCGSGSLVLCEHCRDNYYSECVECGHLVCNDDLHYLNDDDEGYCDSCWRDHEACQVIQSYYYKPQPIFYGEGKRFLGVELEMDGGGERDSNARQILSKANGNGLEHAYAKHDGSLDEGIELVTHPMTLEYVAIFMSDQEIKNLSWSDFAAGCTAPELVQYLKERRLYVSDPVEAAEEV